MKRENRFFFPVLLSLLLIFFLCLGNPALRAEENDETDTEEEIAEEEPARTTTPRRADEERDPFEAPWIGEDEGIREPGLPGMSIQEIELLGIAKVRGEYEAYVKGPGDKKPYRMKVNQQLRDGYVQRITANEIVYMQKDDDPVVKDKYTPIIKRLREEGK